MKTYTVRSEPRGDEYRSLIDCASKTCAIALVVVRPTIALSKQGSSVLGRLEPYLQNRSEEAEWPGTRLESGCASIFRYRLTRECQDILKGSARSIYEWHQPDLPEDLCFLRLGGEPYFVSISHEHDSYFVLSDQERRDIADGAPSLSLYLEADLK